MKENVVRLGKAGHLVGIIAEPAITRGDVPAFILLNAGIVHRVGPNRLYVNAARALAEAGHPALRFDVSGLGDSEARRDGLSYQESRLVETREAMDHLETQQGVGTFVLLGLCSGADQAFRVACVDSRVVGVVLIDGYAYRTQKYYVVHYGRRLFRLSSWWNFATGRHPVWRALRDKLRNPRRDQSESHALERFVIDLPPRAEAEADLRTLIQRPVHMLVLYTGGQEGEYNYGAQFRDMFPSVPLGDQVRVLYWPSVDHTFTRARHQRELLDMIADWARGIWPSSPTATQ